MFGLFKKPNYDAMNATPKALDQTPNPNTDNSWENTKGTRQDIAMQIYQSMLKLDSSEKLIFRVGEVPGFQFTITKDKI